MEKTKVTKRVRFEELKGIVSELGRIDLVEFIDNELGILERKANSPRAKKVSEEDIANKKIIEKILEETAEGLSVSEIQKQNEALKELSTSKVTALVKKLIEDEKVQKLELTKKKTVYKLI